MITKIILVGSCLSLMLIFFNYPVFDSVGISYLIIFLCLIVISFSGAKIYSGSKDESYKPFEQEMDKLHTNDGIFQYTNDGFYINIDKSNEFIKWKEIIAINSFSIPLLFSEKQTGIEVITDKGNYEISNITTLGTEKLIDQLFNNLPSWEFNSKTIKINNWGLKKVNLYNRSLYTTNDENNFTH